MKRLFTGVVLGILIGSLLTFSVALGTQPIKLLVNGQEIKCDVPPQIVNGRTMVPISAVSKALGCQVSWDASQGAVIVTSAGQTAPAPQTPSASTSSVGLNKNNPVPCGQSLTTADGMQVTVNGLIEGDAAWSIISAANQFNAKPEAGFKYVLVNVTVKNISSQKEPAHVSNGDFSMVGSSSKVFHSYEKSVVLPDNTTNQDISSDLYHGGSTSGALAYYVPAGESNYTIIWKSVMSIKDSDKRYFVAK